MPKDNMKRASYTSILLAACATAVACSDAASTGPAESALPLNRMVVSVSGSRGFAGQVDAGGGFYSVVGGSSGIRIGGQFGVHAFADDVGGVPFSLNIPGDPVPGVYTIGRWDPATYSRKYFEPVLNVGRKPVVSFGLRPGFSLGRYASIEGGVLEINDALLPPERAFFRTGFIRGRVTGRAAAHPDLLLEGETFHPETVTVTAEFHVQLENWPDGLASVRFTEGPLSFVYPDVSVLRGSGSKFYYRSTSAPPRLVIGFGIVRPATRDTIQLWFGTKLTGAGTTSLGRMGASSLLDVEDWESDFAAGYANGQFIESVAGTLELESYEEETQDPDFGDLRWGEAHGRLTVEFDLLDQSVEASERSKAVIEFRVPVGFWILVCQSKDLCRKAGNRSEHLSLVDGGNLAFPVAATGQAGCGSLAAQVCQCGGMSGGIGRGTMSRDKAKGAPKVVWTGCYRCGQPVTNDG